MLLKFLNNLHHYAIVLKQLQDKNKKKETIQINPDQNIESICKILSEVGSQIRQTLELDNIKLSLF